MHFRGKVKHLRKIFVRFILLAVRKLFTRKETFLITLKQKQFSEKCMS